MAILDIVFYQKDLDLEEARGNTGTLVDVEALGPAPGYNATKINEEARGNLGTLVDLEGTPQKIEELILRLGPVFGSRIIQNVRAVVAL